MWYKRYSCIGIREKFGKKKQVMSFGSSSGLGQGALRGWADQVLERLDAGGKVATTKKWVLDSLPEFI